MSLFSGFKFSYSKTFFLSLPLILFLGLIPYRVLGLYHVPFEAKVVIGFVFLLFFWQVKEDIIQWFLNFSFTQLIFYYMLAFEKFLENCSLFGRIVISFNIGLCLGGWPSLSEDSMFWYLLIIIFFSFYKNMKIFFLNPAMEGCTFKPDNQPLSWQNISDNMSSVSLILFKVLVENKLGGSLNRRAFPEISRRYVFSRIIHGIKSNPEVVAAAGTVGAGLGFSIGQYTGYIQHRENLELARDQLKLEQRKQEFEEKKHQDLKNLEYKKAGIEIKEQKGSCIVSSPIKEENIFSRISRFFEYFFSGW